MFRKILAGFSGILLALLLTVSPVLAARGPSGTSSGSSNIGTSRTLTATSSRGPSGTSSSNLGSGRTVSVSRGPSGTGSSTSKTSTSNTSRTTTSTRGPSGTGSGTSGQRTTTSTRQGNYYNPSTRTYTTRTSYFYSGWGGYYGCVTCFSGPYAYGPVGVAGYYPPAPVEGFIFILLLVVIVLAVIWWYRRNSNSNDYYATETETVTRNSPINRSSRRNVDKNDDTW